MLQGRGLPQGEHGRVYLYKCEHGKPAARTFFQAFISRSYLDFRRQTHIQDTLSISQLTE